MRRCAACCFGSLDKWSAAGRLADMLKFSYSNEADIPANVKAFYKKQADDTWQLDVEGAVPTSKLNEFRENNRTLKAENDKFKADFEGVDAAEYKKLKGRAELFDDGKLVAADKIEEKITARTTAMKTEHEKVLGELNKRAEAAEARVAEFLIDGELRKAATELGVLETAVDDVLLRGKTTFKMVNGKATAFGPDGKEIYRPKDGEPLNIRDFVEDLAKKATHLFKPSKGAGAEGGSGGGHAGGKNPWKKETFNLTQQMQITRENPALATRLKSEAGVS